VLRRADLITVGLAAAVHAGIGLYVMRGQKPAAPRPKTVELQFARRPEPPPEPPAPEAAPKPPTHAPAVRRVAATAQVKARRAAAPSAAPPPSFAPAPEPSGAPPPPVYAFAMSSTSDLGATVAVPRGAPGGMGSPNDSPLGSGGRRGSPGGTGDGQGYHPVSAGAVGAMPEVDADACGRAARYPREAEQSGIEGDVRLRVALTEEGRVQSVRVLSGLGHGLDQAAIDALKNRCKFSAALGHDGRPVAFVIQSYTFHFELPR
jgi:protein TonB